MLYAYAYLLPIYVKLMHYGLTFMLLPINPNTKGFWNWIWIRIFHGYIPFFLGVWILDGIERFF